MYEVQLNKERSWYYRVISRANGQTLMVSETYATKFNARRQAKKVYAALKNAAYKRSDITYKEVA